MVAKLCSAKIKETGKEVEVQKCTNGMCVCWVNKHKVMLLQKECLEFIKK